MFNVTVLKIKDIVRYLSSCIIIIILIIVTSKFLSSKKDKKTQIKISDVSIGSFISCLDETLPTISGVYEENNEMSKNENKEEKNYLEEILKTQISSMRGIEEEKQKTKQDEKEKTQIEETKEKVNITLASMEHANTEIVTNNPIAENYNVQYGNVKIKNQTSYTLTQDMMKPDISIENKNVIIFHTHSCESYTSSEKYAYNPTGNYRTTDLNYSVTRVGTELENYLKKYNLNAIHNKSYHDYPSYNGSYTRSLETVENILQSTPSDIIIDLHRDAIGSREDYAPTVKIGEDYCAQIMFVIRYK